VKHSQLGEWTSRKAEKCLDFSLFC